MDLQLIGLVSSLATAIATIALVMLLYTAIKQMESTVNLTRIQTEYQFRPWLGPSSGIKKIEPSINEKIQFEITIKNFGELPSMGVTAKHTFDDKKIQRQEIIENPKNTFELGPMLPNMEKKYWFFIDPEHWQRVLSGQDKLFTGIYFEYNTNDKKNGYGIISEYILASHNFIHNDMWID